MGKCSAKILEIDWKCDIGYARSAVPPESILMGNVNPSDPMCIGSPQDVREQVRAIIEKTKGRGLLLSSGCALGANTKPENMAAFMEAAREFGRLEPQG